MPGKDSARSIAVDPRQPKNVYALGTRGTYRSTDAGQKWTSASTGLPKGGITAFGVDVRQPARLYAIRATGALYMSKNGARSWRMLRGTG